MAGLFQIGPNVIQAHEMLSLLSRYHLMPQFLRGLVIDRAIADVEFTEEERQQAVINFRKQHRIIEDADIARWMQENNLSIEGLEELAIRPMRLEKFKESQFGRKVENYFVSQKSRLDKVVYSLIRVQDEGLAQEIYYRIEEGESSFAEMARTYSQGPEAQTNGILGPVPLNQPHPFIARMLEVSQPGQLWPPRALVEWFIIVRLEQFLPSQLDEAMRRQMIDEMFENWMREQIQALGSPQLLWAASDSGS
ncbi:MULTISPECIES: peptidylprolyl isomerase [Limnothrix]|nr:peptidylprolyl isomerase [Limnothrix sp. FACHB-1083]MBD2190192.1 peptidylprolyl isomerase [Limnothrix sp. FACHB-1088]